MPTNLKRVFSNREDSDSELGRTQKKSRNDDQDSEIDDDEEFERSIASSEGDEDSDVEEELSSSDTYDVNAIDLNNLKVNEAGTIARVELVDFMCHKYLKIEFGPKINFVIGHNGSGKSAILTAITIALGANASATNRGKNLGDFIREGANAANITIHLTNRGSTPYKPDLYPNIIIVERRINKEGGSGYKLKNSSGHIVSTKKEDLVAILDHLNILVNNPLTMLTQDMARKFLSDSTPEDKYKLFMLGTQLAQLQRDFETVRESLETARETLDRKKQGLPALQAKANEAQKQYEDINEAKQVEEKIDILNNELVWSQIIQKEKENEKFKREFEIVEQKLAQLNEACDAESEKLNTITERIRSETQEWEAFLNEPNPDEQRKQELIEKKAEQEREIRETKSDLQGVNNDIKRTKAAKERIENLLKAELQKIEDSSRIKRDEIQKEIDKCKEKIAQMVEEAKQFSTESAKLEEEYESERAKRESIVREMATIKHRREECVRFIQHLEGQRGDSMKAYGSRMSDVLDAIRRETRWEKRRPVGPFGATLQLLKPQFADTLETVLNKNLNAFVVESFHDKNLLFNILARFNMKTIPIIISDYDIFDYSSGEPDSQYLTVLRALKFNDEWVKRQFIVANKIEKILLMEDRQKADDLMRTKPRNIDLCFTSGGHKVGGRSGMKTVSIESYRGPPRFQKDIDGQIRKYRTMEEELKQKYNEYELEIREIKVKMDNLEKRKRDCRRSEDRLDREIKNLEHIISEKEDDLKVDDQIDQEAYQKDIKEAEEKIRAYILQFHNIKGQHDAVISEIKETIRELKALQNKDAEREKISNEFRARIKKLEDVHSEINNQLEALKIERTTTKSRRESRYTQYVNSGKLVKQWTEQAIEEYPDRVSTDRTPHEVEKDIQHLQALAREWENKVGFTAEELAKRTYEVLKAWNDADNTVKGMEKLYRSLRKMLAKRIEKWDIFRQHISISAKNYFRYFLHMRGDEGAIKFNHESRKLEIRVSTGDQYSKGSRQKDSRSLSGGEKSFSQISLLLSLWQSISSPIICLDEFDVFMDAVNRKQTMSMIMNSASDNSSQYILITPQDASNMVPGPYVTIHRLADPER
ncbi:MAG: P-loop containing nucleoside triphosphate hydrolase protein [Benjaminiella poitrasii]|nr:MAG: P-loop containing nucleoside triphosphate hydrolase protein [Benjaminiella poitrasii]